MDILTRGGSSQEEQSEVVERAAKEVSRIDSILREFLDIARPSKEAPGPLDVNRLMKDTISTLDAHKDFGRGSITTALAEDLPPVIMDEGKLRQVFLNLLLNALQSLDPAKADNKVTVKTGIIDASADSAETRMRRSSDRLSEKGCVFISFTDTGGGVSPEDALKIFDPFFTTKEVGAGTGLGLFVSQSIIKTYGGEVDFTSRVASGSTFTIKLPFARLET
jgi:signal transduction histidine kinase